MFRYVAAVAALLISAVQCAAHDQWVEVNTNVTRVGDAVHINLMLGNHGNDHRDFKVAGKADPAAGSLEIIAPGGKRFDLLSELVDTGYAPREGYWTTRFVGEQEGLYAVARLSDQVVRYAPKRSVQSAKAFFVLSHTLDKVAADQPDFDRPLGHPYELVPEVNPVATMGPGRAIRLRLLFRGQPAADEVVSFVARGEQVAEGFDPLHQAKTDSEGRVTFVPREGNHYLVSAHREQADETGNGYDSTKYAATLWIYVPQTCPCCLE
jgi:uncharacterized GH25 family protein